MNQRRDDPNNKTVAENRKARFNYEIARHGRGRPRADRHRGEVAAQGQANIQESYAVKRRMARSG